ncbi:PREDICTED: uncharacterized protein LOC104744109 [Camelina sativa]|uniref:Uncharacterized protein LOC104744109 n=1 Tax=Camelina sativa TaxID=90675 RepID=A0ABM0VZ41_CAMSA|nr:PREDICTED: uncharacterized protein LOC104744109 [Camelina sativa]
MLLWTISDFPAYGNLAGCKVKGKMGCPICGKHTNSLWLSHSRKHVYMCHRKSLSPLHSFRGKNNWFDGKAEHETKGRILTGRNISLLLRNYKNDFGNRKDTGKKRSRAGCDIPSDNEDEYSASDDEEEDLAEKYEEELSRWKKRSIFFTMPYWEESRKDLETLGIKNDLHPKAHGKRTLLPAEECKVMGLKSHDYHVLMQQLLPVAVRVLLPKGPRIAIFRICAFFNCVHLGREARLAGPIHFRWMYPFERYMKVLKDYVRNPARPEGCIAESYLAEECMKFSSDFLKTTTNVEEKEERNTEYESHSILEGRPISAGTSFNLTDMDRKIAHLAVIQNTTMVEPYIDIYKTHMVDVDVMQVIYGDETLKWLAYGPRSIARSYTGYIVNGMQFHTKSMHRLSQNSGVYYEATAMCRPSARDTAQLVDVVSYYGRIVDIILLDYNVFYVPIFRCHLDVKGNNVKVEDGFTLINMNQSQMSFAKDPFILASHARQIFYSRENDESSWFVVLKGPSRRYSDENEEDGWIAMGGKGKKGARKRKTNVEEEDPEFVGTIYPHDTQPQDTQFDEPQPQTVLDSHMVGSEAAKDDT